LIINLRETGKGPPNTACTRCRHGDAGGSLRVFRQFAWLEVGSVKVAFSRPTHQRVTPAVETVEKVPFQKMIFEKWDRNAEKRLVFGVPHNIVATFWRFLSLLWEIFMNIFRTKGFSTVSLGGLGFM
jgi:hypothetical protein